MKKSKKAKDEFKAIYKFMAEAYHGNWQYRWGGVPYMLKSSKAGKKESIVGHEWSAIGLWLLLKDVCPNLAKIVNTEEIYEILWSHDLGETFIGDVSHFKQLSGFGKNKNLLEEKEIKRMTKNLFTKTSKKLNKYFNEFEKPLPKITHLETLVAKLMDNLQGNHYAFTFAIKLTDKPNEVAEIVNRTSVRTANQLLKVLRKRGYKKAHAEVLKVVEYHIDHYRNLGIKLKPIYSK